MTDGLRPWRVEQPAREAAEVAGRFEENGLDRLRGERKRERRHEHGRMLVRAVVRVGAVLMLRTRRVRGPILFPLWIVRIHRG